MADGDGGYRLLLRVRVDDLEGVELVGDARDGIEAVELALARHADAVLLDCLMARMNGFEAARVIRETLPAVKLYLHSASQTRANADAAEALGLTLLDKFRVDETLRAVAGRKGSERPVWELPSVDEDDLPSPDSRRLRGG